MDSTAIKQIQETSTTKVINDELTRSNVGHHVVALPENFKLASLEKYHETRDRFRGVFSTASVGDFGDYVKNFLTEGASTFIDAEKMSAKHIVDLGTSDTAGHCEHKALLKLEKTAPYLALLDIINNRKTQKEVAEFIEDWRSNLHAFYEEDAEGVRAPMNLIKALHAVRKIKIEAASSSETTVSNFGASTSSMDSIDIKSQDVPPASLSFTCEPYHGLPQRTFTLRLSIITDRAPALVLRIVQKELHDEEMAKQFQTLIIDKVDKTEPPVNIYVGNFSE